MTRRTQRRSRSEITETHREHTREYQARGDESRRYASDLRLIAADRRSLEGGTCEGHQEVLSHIERAKDATSDGFERADEKVEQTQQEAKEHESQIREMAETGRADEATIRETLRQLETSEGKENHSRALEPMSSDIAILEDQLERSENAREQSERQQENLRDFIESLGG